MGWVIETLVLQGPQDLLLVKKIVCQGNSVITGLSIEALVLQRP